MNSVLLILFYLLAAASIVFLCNRYKWMNSVGPIIWAYGIGLIIGSIHILPDGALKSLNSITEIAVPLAIPLILFSLNLKSSVKLAKTTFLSMITAFIGVFAAIIIGFFIFKDSIPEANKVAGMLTGVYIGGTANMFAIKTALGADNNLFILVQTYDMVIGGITLLFILTVAQRGLELVLPKFKKSNAELDHLNLNDQAEFDDYTGILKKKTLLPLFGALLLSGIIVAIGLGIMALTPENAKMATVILTITTLGLAASFIPKVNQIRKTFQLGMYLIVVFSMAIASMADIKMLFHMAGGIFVYVLIAVYGSLLIQILLSRWLKIDADTTIITNTAFIFSVPFIPLVAGALKNKEIIISGIAVGVIGYASSNYLGVTLSYLLGLLM